MRHSDPTPPQTRRIDAPAWLCLAWAVVFGSLYAAMIVEQRGASLLAAFRRLVE